VVLIIRSGETSAAHVRRTRNLLQSVNARMLGIVVNAADLTSPDYYYYYYGSKYNYAYGKKGHKTKLDDSQDVSERGGESEQDGTTPRPS